MPKMYEMFFGMAPVIAYCLLIAVHLYHLWRDRSAHKIDLLTDVMIIISYNLMAVFYFVRIIAPDLVA